jgi:hypothetical protein
MINEHASAQSRPNRARAGTMLIVVCGLVVAVGLVCSAAATLMSSGGASGAPIAIIVVCILAVVVLLRGAHHAEHQLRGHTPVAQSCAAADPFGAGSGPPEGPTGPRAFMSRRTYSPSSLGFSVVVLGLLVLVFVVEGASNYSQAQRSAYVQQHGTSATATVVNVANTQHCGRRSCHWTAAIPVTFSTPVDGTTATTAHYPSYSMLSSGDRVIVLVDPKQPGYAELPGSPFKSSLSWIIDLLFAAGLVGVALYHAARLRAVQSHRRDHFARPSVGLAASSA